MRLRIGLAAGFAAGVYVATIAGQRSRQLRQQARGTLRKGAFDVATEKARAVVDLGVERARDVMVSKLGDQGLVRPIVQAPARLAAQHRDSAHNN
jgi:hypothetical protein